MALLQFHNQLLNNNMQANEPLDSAQVLEACAPTDNNGSPKSSLAGVEGKKLIVLWSIKLEWIIIIENMNS